MTALIETNVLPVTTTLNRHDYHKRMLDYPINRTDSRIQLSHARRMYSGLGAIRPKYYKQL